MEWHEEALALGARRHGETDVILEVLTRQRGRHLGLVRGGRSRRLRAVLQPGNSLKVTWRARLSEHLGNFRVEPVTERAAELMMSRCATYGIQALAAHLRLLPERDPHPKLYDAATVIVENLHDPDICGELMVRFEVLLLEELGFGMDLGTCAATGTREDLAYVSPKSGRAVSRAAGLPYDNRMLKLPAFLIDRRDGDQPNSASIQSGFDLTGHFLTHHIYQPRSQPEPDERGGFIRAVVASLASAAR